MARSNIKPENQRRVVHISENDLAILVEPVRVFWDIRNEFLERKNHHMITLTMNGSVTYLFEIIEDAEYFGKLLDKREIPYSLHPAKDYDKIATQNMDDFGKLIYNSLRL